jgi:hypothetical protein
MTEAKPFRTFIRIYSLLKIEHFRANIELTISKALIRSVMTYACTAWELAADTCLLKLQRLQNEVIHTIGNFPRCTPFRDVHMASNLPYTIRLYKKIVQATSKSQQNHENEHVRNIGKKEARRRKYKRLKLGRGQADEHSSCSIRYIR